MEYVRREKFNGRVSVCMAWGPFVPYGIRQRERLGKLGRSKQRPYQKILIAPRNCARIDHPP
jgi:hypothetical protein